MLTNRRIKGAVEVLTVNKITKDYGGLRACEGVSFGVNAGERVVIIGPNGAGKSTLLNMIGGQLQPTEGEVLFFGKDITSLSPHERAHIGIGRSFQIVALFNGLTVLQNVLLGVQGTRSSRFHMHKSSSRYVDCFDQAEELLHSMDLWNNKDEVVDFLAYGEQRKLEILLSLVSKPKLLLLDEPSCGLTAGESAEITEMIRRLGKDIAVLLVAHDIDLVFSVADRIIVLHYGKIITEGTCDEIRCDIKVKEIYMGIDEGAIKSRH